MGRLFWIIKRNRALGCERCAEGAGWHGTAVLSSPDIMCNSGHVNITVSRFFLSMPHLAAACRAGAMGGRIDHTLSNLNTLLTHSRLRIVLLGDASTARLLPVGACSIRPALVSFHVPFHVERVLISPAPATPDLGAL